MNQQLIKHIEEIETKLDSVVDHGTDDELFIASYLQGHFAVIARSMEVDSEATLTKLNSSVKHSLERAFSQGELVEADQKNVLSLWQTLITV